MPARPSRHLRSSSAQRVVESIHRSVESLIPASEPPYTSFRPFPLSFALVLRLCSCLCSSMLLFLVLSSAASCPMFSFGPSIEINLSRQIMFQIVCFEYSLPSFRAGKSGCQNTRAGLHGFCLLIFVSMCQLSGPRH